MQVSVEAGLATTKPALVLQTPKNNTPLPPLPTNQTCFRLELAPPVAAAIEMPHATQKLALLILVMTAIVA
jgi:hypothetical protein